MRSPNIFRTKKEIDAEVKKLQKTQKAWGVSNVRPVKATKKEYNRYITSVMNGTNPDGVRRSKK